MRVILRSPVVWVAAALLAGIFAVDLHYSGAISVRTLYVGVALLGLWSPRLRLALVIAGASTILTVLAYLLAPDPSDPQVALLNRIISLAVLWITAGGITRFRYAAASRKMLKVGRRHTAEDAQRRSLKDLEDIQHALDQSAIVATTNVRGDITSVNDKFCEISRYGRDELIGRNHRILNSGLHPIDFFREMYATIGRGNVWRGEIRNRAKDGSLYWVDTTIVPFLDDRQRPYQYIAIRYDITERKASEAAFREQTALAQLGKMAAVVAHEVRNPLAGIRGALQIIGKRLPEGGREQAIAGEIVSRIDGLNNIVQDLLQFARPRQPILDVVPIVDLMDETTRLLCEDPQFAELTIHVDTDGARVRADREQLKLALLNLLMNGAQAMQGRGQIEVSTKTAHRLIELRIEDHGPGIPPEVRERLFEPFFTTKHRGTGLGLATTRRILEAHGGSVELASPAGGGTIAIVKLPAAP